MRGGGQKKGRLRKGKDEKKIARPEKTGRLKKSGTLEKSGG